MKPTIKSILTLNKLSNPNAILIPSYTGEYLNDSTNYGSILISGDSYTIFESLLKPIDDLIKQFDKAFPEGETLNDQCSRISFTDFLALNINII